MPRKGSPRRTQAALSLPLLRWQARPHWQCEGLIRKRWLDDALKLKKEIQDGGPRQPLSNEEMTTAAQKGVVEAANARRDGFTFDHRTGGLYTVQTCECSYSSAQIPRV